jgi:uncharacterized protein (AIM24 family)
MATNFIRAFLFGQGFVVLASYGDNITVDLDALIFETQKTLMDHHEY